MCQVTPEHWDLRQEMFVHTSCEGRRCGSISSVCGRSTICLIKSVVDSQDDVEERSS